MPLRQPVLRIVRSALFGLCRAARVQSAVGESRWRRQRLLVLGYHGISVEDEHLWNPELYVSLPVFESRMQTLAQHGYSVLPLDEGLELLSSGRLPARSVALTFDDGMYDFHARAYPVLRRHRFPATVYLTTYYCEFNRPVFDLVVPYVLWAARPGRWRPCGLLGLEGEFDLPANRAAAARAIRRHAEMEGFSGPEKDDFVARIAAALDVDYGAIREKRLLHVMNPQEVSELAGAGVNFQLHTHRHRTPSDRKLFEREIDDNVSRIEALTGARPAHFCYPNGSHSDEQMRWLRERGIRSATTCHPGIASRRTPPLLLPRFIDTSAVSPLVFESWLAGVGPWLARRQP